MPISALLRTTFLSLGTDRHDSPNQLPPVSPQVDRARAIFIHVSFLCDPRRDKAFWAEFRAFEVASGNEDSFLEMLRIQR